MHHVALDRAWTYDRDLDDEIVETFRPEARQHRHLRTALDLEHAERVGTAKHAINGSIFFRNSREREESFPRLFCFADCTKRKAIMFFGELKCFAQASQHAESEHIDLEKSERVEIVFVPFDEGAVVHRTIADRHHLVEPAPGEDEAADMLRKMAWEGLDAFDQGPHFLDPGAIDIDAGAFEDIGAHRAAAHAPDR